MREESSTTGKPKRIKKPHWKKRGPSIHNNKLRPTKLRFQSFEDLDLRTIAARRAHDIVNALVQDLGGADAVTAAEKQIVQHAGVLAAFIEDQEVKFICGNLLRIDDLLAAINVQRRLLQTVGLQRRSKDVTPDLQTYLRQRERELAQKEAEDVDEQEAAG